ncbi:hypothetical protein Tco_0802686 [Tanacetum coccineum]|uniref:Reverse transcriptase domain-containing protein n=1 Tax=Tanacetum coccineum TaxID=301880 RepID=A0ABQ5A3P3_9ASTR
MLRACILYFRGSWDIHLLLVEFSYNNSYHASVRCAPFDYVTKSYADKRRKPLEFSVGDYVLLKVSPWKGVVCFGKKGKLAPSNEIPSDAKLNFVEELVEIFEREFKKLKRSRIAIVKLRWNLKRGLEFTWELEDQMKLKYPHLFSRAAVELAGECLLNNVKIQRNQSKSNQVSYPTTFITPLGYTNTSTMARLFCLSTLPLGEVLLRDENLARSTDTVAASAIEKDLWATGTVNEEYLKSLNALFGNFLRLRASEPATLSILHLETSLSEATQEAALEANTY